MNNKKRLELLYEDRWIIVVNKPSGMLSMSTGKAGELTAYNLLKDHSHSLFIVHRLDRDTSGIMLFAKDEQTKRLLQDNWNDIVIERRYTALLEGEIEDSEGFIETWLYECPKSLKVYCYSLKPGENPETPPRKDWKFAASHCRTIKSGSIGSDRYTCVEFELETGRKNQIRVHSQWIGHPVAGDKKYGARTNPLGRLALHAKTLSFIHPHTGKEMKFTSRLPKGFSL